MSLTKTWSAAILRIPSESIFSDMIDRSFAGAKNLITKLCTVSPTGLTVEELVQDRNFEISSGIQGFKGS
jgi:hypothetical protein